MEYLSVVEYCFADHHGGAPRVAWDIARLMRERGASVTLLSYCTTAAEHVGPAMVDGIEVVRYRKEEKPAWHPDRLAAIIDSAERACRLWLAGRRFDCVHVHSPLQGLGVMRAISGAPHSLATVHSPLLLEQEVQWRHQGVLGHAKMTAGRQALLEAEAELLRQVSVIHVLSQFTRGELERMHGLGGRVQVIPHWFAPRSPPLSRAMARAELGWPADAPVFFTVRAQRPRYGVDVAIKALAPLLPEFDARFYVAGTGPLRQQLETLARRLDPDGRIRFLGTIPDRELELAYAAADLFILPTVALECFGLITLEAFHMGCPVLSTDAAAIPEVMQPILPEMIVPAGDVAALQARARQFLEGRIRLPAAQALSAYAERNYGRAVIAPRLAALIEGLDGPGLALPVRAAGAAT